MLEKILNKATFGFDLEEAIKIRYSFYALLASLAFHALQLPIVYFLTSFEKFLPCLVLSLVIFLIPLGIIFGGNFYFFSLLIVSLEWLLTYYLQFSLHCGSVSSTLALVQMVLLSYTFFVHGAKSGFSLLLIVGSGNLLALALQKHGILEAFCQGKEIWEIERKYGAFFSLPNLILLGIIFAFSLRVTKELEELSRKKSHWQKAIIDSGIQYLALITPEGKILLQDKKSRSFLRIAKARGREKPTFWDYYPPKAQEILKEALSQVLTGKQIRLELEIPFSPRRVNYFDVSLVPVKDKAGNIESIIVAGLEITERKKMEEQIEWERRQLRAIIENIPHLVVSLDPELNIVFMNRAFEKSFSVHNLKFSSNVKNFLDQMPHDYRPIIGEKLQECLEGKNVYYELIVPDVEGKNRIYGISYHPILGSENKTQGIAIFAEDITQRKEYENALLNAKKAAEEANRVKTEFLANMSHEMRTPLNIILGYVDLILEKKSSVEEKDYALKIQKAATDLKELIEDILELSQLETGPFQKQEIDFEVSSFFKSLLQFFHYEAMQKKLTLELELDPSLPKFLSMDVRRLRLILLNLLSNAVKFTQAGYVKLRVKKVNLNQQNFLQVDVEDSGPGIDESLQEKIFERFTQGDSSYTKKFKGTGLGLAICRQLIEKLEGKIFLKSTLGKGSIFSVVLPYKESQKLLEKMPSKEEIEQKTTPSRKTILVVEDNEENMILFDAFLKSTPHRLLKAKNGLEALEIFQKEKVDLILMDMQMPIMDGFTATKKIRELEKIEKRTPTPIAAVTAYVTPREIELLLDSGCDAYLAKPFKKDNLLQLVNKLLLA